MSGCPLPAAEESRCPLCGGELLSSGGGEAVCGSCPIASHCDLRCCPRCGYTLAPPSRFLSFLQRLLGRRPGPSDA